MERVADYIIKTVRKAGSEHIFLVTGRGILYLTDAVAKDKSIGVSTYHEQGASYAAMAYAAVKNGISSCLVSTGCAAANAVTAALCAYQDNLPVVFISGQNMLNETTRYTGVPIRTYGSQEADIISLVESITKYAVMLTDPNEAAYEIEKALYIAEEGRKGPVWIDIPLDVQNMRINPETCKHYKPEGQDTYSAHSQRLNKAVKEVAAELNKAARPLLLIGGGIASAGAGERVKRLVEEYHLPLAFSPTASDTYGTSHDLSIGAVGSIGGSRSGNFAVQNADYILAVGTKLCSQETGMKNAFAREAKITVVDIDENEIKKNGVCIERFVHADAKEFLDNLLHCDLSVTSNGWTEKCKHWKSLLSIKNEAFIKELKEKDELDLYSLMDMLSDILPDNATVITDAGLEELIVPSTIRFKDNQICLFPASQGAMGYAIPAIIGAYYAGRKNIVCIVGDGSFMMNMQELQFIGANRIPVKILVINNNMYAIIRKRQKDLFRNRTIGNDPSDGVSEPDFAKIAESFNISYQKISTLSEMTENLSILLDTDSNPELIEIISTPEQKYFHESYALNEKRRLERRPIEDMSPFLDRQLVKDEMIIKPYL